MRLFTTVAGLRCYLALQRQAYALEGQSLEIGFVPTMGALHDGHISLVNQARQHNGLVVVSIFVNPLQFSPNEDFSQYPRTLETDRQRCESAGVDVLFVPTAEILGLTPPGSEARLTQVLPPSDLTSGLCGRSRPGHFQGVATIVTKLLNLVQPDRAYFGQKDAQQLRVIQQLVADLNLPVAIMPCPIWREPTGLAYSSRNEYLSADDRRHAAGLYQSLKHAESLFLSGERHAQMLVDAVKQRLGAIPAITLDYVELVDPQTLLPLETIQANGLLAIAVYLGSTRLIDNLMLRTRRPIITIDGPAGAGKSTVTRLVAEALGLQYLDTGAMYRGITWLVLQAEVPFDDQAAIAELVSHCQLEFQPLGAIDHAGNQRLEPRLLINQDDVTEVIRGAAVTAAVSAVSALPIVRTVLVEMQRRYGEQGGIVADGRDMGTHVFPDADLKIFLTASVAERARRRHHDLVQQGQGEVTLETLETTISSRDHQDSNRAISPLKKATDAIEIQTDDLSIQEVVNLIIQHYQRVAH